MIRRLVGAVGTLLVALALGTLIAEAVMFAYVWSKWQINGEKVQQMVAIAQGYDLVEMRDQAERERKGVSTEQPSPEQVVEARAKKDRNLELREQALAQGIEQLRVDQRKHAEELASFKQTRAAFDAQLTKLKGGEQQSGIDQNIAMIENMKPKQAKEQLLQMYEKKEIDAVVRLMAGMAAAKRKKISAEFRTPEENEKLGEILRRIREGYPLAMVADETEKHLQKPLTTQ
ncbi:MAG: hypothetical protein NTW96_13120 [Planctomycetia bacterium]|nr:hypothetical protein [Planctomycetia bacterium]